MRRRQLLLAPATINDTPFDVPTLCYRQPVTGGHMLDITVHGPDDTNAPLLINCLPWSEYVMRQDATARYATMAHLLGMRVMSLDNPGVGAHQSTLSKAELGLLRNGSLEPFVDMQHEAVRRVAEKAKIDLANVALFGDSLGTIVAWQLAEHLQPRSLVLCEPVGITPVHPARLVADFAHDALASDRRYKHENPGWYQALSAKLPPQKVPLLAGIPMMARGGYFAPLQIPQTTKITAIRGSKSWVSKEQPLNGLMSSLPDGEIWTLEGENHAMINSLGRHTALLLELQSAGRL